MVQRTTRPRTQSPGIPNYTYESFYPLWRRARAVLNGEHAAKQHDRFIDTTHFNNLLLPFSPFMESKQYAFYKAEAELPGLVSQYAKVLTGGLLRKLPQYTLSDKVPEEARDWLDYRFTSDERSLLAFLDEALWEEMTTSRAVIMLDHPVVEDWDALEPDERDRVKPFPVLWKAENVINWSLGINKTTGNREITRVIIHYFGEEFEEEADFQPLLIEYVADHRLDPEGHYKVTYYRRTLDQTVHIINGQIQRDKGQTFWLGTSGGPDDNWEQVSEVYPEINGEYLTYIPCFPLNGSIVPKEPILMPLVDREISLYNKMSRRNHLLYTASTFTPVFMTSITDSEFQKIVDQGLGTYIRLNPEDRVDALRAPADALTPLSQSIQSTVDELAKMGVRMLAPETTNQSGVALEIRNSAQTAQLSTLNVKISRVMTDLISLMIEWKYGIPAEDSKVEFSLSTDFNPTPIGQDWMRIVTEWYEAGHIPRSMFIDIGKKNDIIPADYSDEEGLREIRQRYYGVVPGLEPEVPEEFVGDERAQRSGGPSGASQEA
jgi:hypothetical protein